MKDLFACLAAVTIGIASGAFTYSLLSKKKALKFPKNSIEIDDQYFMSDPSNRDVQYIASNLRSFEFKGVPKFCDIGGILENPEAFKKTTDLLIERYLLQKDEIDAVAVFDSRGFLFGTFIAQALNKPCVMLRKIGKLPGPTVSVKYETEYSSDELCCSINAIRQGDRVLLVDDILATGGTLLAGAQLILSLGGIVHECALIAAVEVFKGWRKFHNTTIDSVSLSSVPIFCLIDSKLLPAMPINSTKCFNVQIGSPEFSKIKATLANAPKNHVLVSDTNGTFNHQPMITNIKQEQSK